MDIIPEQDINCPYCGERISVLVDISSGSQRYIEDCEVCCRPIQFDLSVDDRGEFVLTASRDDE